MKTARTSADFLEAARALQPALKERAAAACDLRRVPDESIADLKAGRFFDMLKPARWGGAEAELSAFFEVQALFAEACPSTAWVFGVVAVHSWQLALFDPKAQADVWQDDPSVLISSSYAPTGRVEKTEGGYEVSGRWSFSSGCDHCDWAFLGGFVPTAEGARPDMRTFLIPRSEYKIDDNWHVMGLSATGSKDIVVEKTFVPEHRTHRLIDGFKCTNPGNASNPSPLFRLPFGQVFVRSVANTALGIARGTLKTYTDVASKRIAASDRSKVALDPTVQQVTTRAANLIDEVELTLARNVQEMCACVEAGQLIPIERRVRFRYDSAHAVEKCIEAVDGLFSASGGRAIFKNNPMHRYFLDIHAARAHYANNPDKPARNLGSILLGADNQDFFI